MVRLAGLEPTTSSSAGMRSIQLSYKRALCVAVAYETKDDVSGAEGGIRTHTPLRTLRPERSASTVPPLRHYAATDIVLNQTPSLVGGRGLEPRTSCV